MSGLAAARALIEKIHHENTPGGTRIASFIRQSLKLVSEQLYHKSTHFLLELLQNADDNQYSAATPTLCITYQPGSLRVDCNEVGFNDKNVEAICTIGDSTKAGSDCFTGEKGVGFKSVFKVADTVWISSKDFSFKLDTREDGELGMIVPRWDAFPEPTRVGYTSFYLRISNRCDEQELMEDLTSFDPTLLMFLRRLKQIELKVNRKDGTIWSERVQRNEPRSGGYITLSCKRANKDYITKTHIVTDLPSEARRAHRSRSEVVLAFPTYELSNEPHMDTQKVYAFLPIRDYGLKFMVQADFLLTANREDIDQSCKWNVALQNEISQAFLEAVNLFNSGQMRYHWPHYLPFGLLIPFLRPMANNIFQELSNRAVLESWAQTLEKPKALAYVPQEFKDNTGTPLTLTRVAAARYLAPKYPAWEVNFLVDLGVQHLSPIDFLLDLEELGPSFPAKPVQWHSQLAKALLPLVSNEHYRGIIKKMKLIPLRTGNWVCIKGHPVYFPWGAHGLNIPSGVEVFVVNPKAANDRWRRKLFEQLGVKECDTFEVCHAILDEYCGGPLPPLVLTREELVAQATYLYKRNWKTEEAIRFWFAMANGDYAQGSKAYIREPVDDGSPQQRVYDILQVKFAFLHDDYTAAVSGADHKWRNWLTTSFGVSSLPRLIEALPSESGDDIELSEEIEFLFAEGDASDVLWFLREHWNDYSKFLGYELFPNISLQSESRFYEALGSLNVTCRNSRSAPLRDTFLPSLDYEMESLPNICILDIQDPKDSSWSFLERLGVTVESNIRYYVRCLELLRNTNLNKHLVVHAYEQIQTRYDGDEELVGSLFHEKSLLCLPPTRLRTFTYSSPWFTARSASPMLSEFEAEYPTCKVLLRSLLIGEDGALAPVVASATFISESMKLCDISQICRELNQGIRGLSRKNALNAIRPLISHPMFPVINSQREYGFDYLAQVSDTTVYIADRNDLSDSFRGIVPLLAFAREDLLEMQGLLSIMKVKWPRLQEIVRSETRSRGRKSVHHDYTAHLKARSNYLQLLVPRSHPNQQTLCTQIANIEAAVASKVLITHTLRIDNTEINGRPSQPTVASSVIGEKLQIFFTEKGVTMKLPNFELVESISQQLQIKEPTHLLLLGLTLSDADLGQIRAAFVQHGLHVPFPSPIKGSADGRKRPRRYAGSSTELHTVSSPFTESITGSREPTDSTYDERMDGALFEMDDVESAEKSRREKRVKRHHEVLPFLKVTQSHMCFREGDTHTTNEKLQYIGELIAHNFFEKHLGSLYKPVLHWTSWSRERAGYPPYISEEKTSSFHLTAESSNIMSSLLKGQGYLEAAHWRRERPVYHFETAITAENQKQSFPLSIAQFERIRKYRLHPSPDRLPDHVSILMRISNVYTKPIIDFHIDPWQLLTSDQLSFTGHTKLKAVLKNTSSATLTDSTLDIFPRHAYRYRPVLGKEIRLLSLLPSEENEDSVRAVIMHTSIEHAGDFRALSYVWGCKTQSCILETPAGRLGITPSLYSALRHLRRKFDPTTLWVDAACINQNDSKEKASQIKLLPHVFQHAISTLVFLGDNTMDDRAIITLMQIRARARQAEIKDGSHDTFGNLRQFDQGATSAKRMQNRFCGDDEEVWPSCLPPIPSSWTDRPIPLPRDPLWEHITEFFGHSWFRRVWVIQEVILASTVRVLYGKWVVDWNDLFGAVEVIDRECCTSKEYSTLKTSWDCFLEIATYHEREARQNRMALIGLLESFRHAKSTLTRDRFFALRGLAADSQNLAFEPDYTSSLKTIVCRLAQAFIRQGKILLLLYRAGLAARSEQCAPQFPSWIPDWTVPKQHCLWESSHRGAQFAASWKDEPRVTYGPSITEIAVYGNGVDVVKKVSETSCTANELRDYLGEVDNMLQALVSRIYESREELKWRVPVAGAKYPRTTPDVETDLHTSYKALRKVLDIDDGTELSEATEATSTLRPSSYTGRRKRKTLRQAPFSTSAPSLHRPDDAKLSDASENYKRALLECLEGWRFFITERGYVGVGPAATQKGDMVAIFDASAVPFLTREHKCVNDEWVCKLVGECYVHGLMNGEAKGLKGLDEGWVTLC